MKRLNEKSIRRGEGDVSQLDALKRPEPHAMIVTDDPAAIPKFQAALDELSAVPVLAAVEIGSQRRWLRRTLWSWRVEVVGGRRALSGSAESVWEALGLAAAFGRALHQFIPPERA